MGHRVALFCGMLLGAAALGTVAIHRATVAPNPGADGTVKTTLLVPAAAAAERSYPRVPENATATAELLAEIETALRDPSTAAQRLPELGHQQQVIYRVLSKQPARSAAVLEALPQRWRSVAQRHLAARREFLSMARGRGPTTLPAWRIIQPEPAEQLLRHYRRPKQPQGSPGRCWRR